MFYLTGLEIPESSLLLAASSNGVIGEIGNAIVSNINTLQNQLLDSPLFKEMNLMGAYLAVLFIALYSFQLAANLQDINKDRAIKMIVAGMLAVYFHVNDGQNLKVFIRANIAWQNTLTDSFASKVLGNRTLGGNYTSISDENKANDAANRVLQTCYNFKVTDPAFDLKGCLETQRASLEPAAQAKLTEKAKALNIDLGGGFSLNMPDLGASLVSSLKSILIETLAAVELAIRVFAQVAQMIFTLLAPLAVGATFLSSAKPPIIDWLINFWKIWLFRFSMLSMSGLVALVFEGINNDAVSLVLGICLAFLSPWLSMEVTLGSGTAIMEGLQGGVGGTIASSGQALNNARQRLKKRNAVRKVSIVPSPSQRSSKAA